ncbi:alpha/beta fold hydrolase [Sneathiella marina]|uniref:Alpha/beta fold hydrolase n=1 Tax=Sneathiella marina TaxID=2950108 RepID=A0ABY4W6S8_9PROT|nr:alpha/beta fold hydrolase [Sneathiella marina]USG62877.1 alpha/beta fold hydrolase [Sneathiella marina]
MTVVEGSPLSLMTADGWTLKVNLFDPPAEQAPASVVMIMPAMGAHARPYRFMASALAAAGHAVLTVDPRGHGQSLPLPRRGVDFSVDDIVRQDMAVVMDHIAATYEGIPVVMLGHSLGGHLSTMYLSENPDAATALITLTATHFHFRKIGVPSLTMFGGFSLLTKIFGYLPGQYVGWGKPSAKTVVRDWVRWGITGRFLGSDGRDLAPAAAALEKPHLSIGFTDDTWLARPAGIDAFNERLPNCTLSRWTLSPEELGVDKLDHFSHLQTGAKVWTRMDRWIRDQI